MHSSFSSILYIGSNSAASTARHRADALRRLGCFVQVIDPHIGVGETSRLWSKINYITGYRLLQRKLFRYLQHSISCSSFKTPTSVWVDGGELIGPRIVQFLSKTLSCPVILFNVDDPCGFRDSGRFGSLLEALPFYDYCFFVRLETVLEAQALGARNSQWASRSYDELLHQPADTKLPPPLSDYVSFIGTFIPRENRDKFLCNLIRDSVPLSIRGSAWKKSLIFSSFEQNYKGSSLSGELYSRAVSSSAVSLGFLSHGNRDLVTQRSFEIPACGGLFCAERTSEHQLLYEEGVEALFWDSAKECADKCKKLLADPDLNYRVRSAGFRRVHEIGVGNEDICRRLLNLILPE